MYFVIWYSLTKYVSISVNEIYVKLFALNEEDVGSAADETGQTLVFYLEVDVQSVKLPARHRA